MSTSNLSSPDPASKRQRSALLGEPSTLSHKTSAAWPASESSGGDLDEDRIVFSEDNDRDSIIAMQRLLSSKGVFTRGSKEDSDATAMLERLHHALNSGYDTQGRAGCMEGTRVTVLEELESWSKDPSAEAIIWLSGMAGVGKTSIAWSLCDMLDRTNRLGGSFFCSRTTGDPTHRDARRIIPSLARLLALRLVKFKFALAKQLDADIDAAERNISRQIEYLLHDPLSYIAPYDIPPLVFVIDALDECSDKSAVEEMLKALVAYIPLLPIKFFVTSRPEPHIRDTLLPASGDVNRILRLHDIEKTVVDDDISHYLEWSLTTPPCAPPLNLTADDIQSLVTFSSGLFICASTAIKYIRGGFPQDRLDRIVRLSNSRGGLWTQSLDEMYKFIVTETLHSQDGRDNFEEEELTFLREVLAAIFAMRSALSISVLAALLGRRSEHLRQVLDRLHAVIHVPEDDDDPSIFALHASFSDFLTGPAPLDIRIQISNGHDTLAQGCLTRLDVDLNFNISRSLTSYLPNYKQELAEIPAALLYASLNFSYHMSAATDEKIPSLIVKLEKTFREKYLYWVEALSAAGQVKKASSIISIILRTPRLRNSEAITKDFTLFLRDAKDFVLHFREVIEVSAPHIYLSALPFTPPFSTIRSQFMPFFSPLPEVHIEGERNRARRLEPERLLQESSGLANSVAFSPNGMLVVSCSVDNTIRIRDKKTGELRMTLLAGSRGYVQSVAFSSDGKQIASGSDDGTIRVWDVQRGELARAPLEGHAECANSIAFSPDGTRIVSGSDDNTICVWDVRKSGPIKPPLKLKGHSRKVDSVAFSPDGARIVSGSFDKTVRVWNAQTGNSVMPPLEGHSRWVKSVSFSRRGTRIISTSADRTIRVWDAQTGEQVGDSETEQNVLASSSQLSSNECQWVTGLNGELLLWVPPEYRSSVYHVPPAPYILTLGSGRVSVDLSRSVHGTDWIDVMDTRH